MDNEITLARRRAMIAQIAADLMNATDRQAALVRYFAWTVTHPEEVAARRAERGRK